MDKIIINGPCKLKGSVQISSSKNACLPILTSTLLFEGPIHFDSLPELDDIETLCQLLETMGAKIIKKDNATIIDASKINKPFADYELVRKMRASILVLGPLLGRFGKAEVSLPGGCAIGTRPIDIHLDGLTKMGASITIEQGYVKATVNKLKGCQIHLPFPSVGATENLMMAAVYAEGETVITNSAMEPEIWALGDFLQRNGVQIEGHGTSKITIIGTKTTLTADKKPLKVMSDRIEALTYIIAGIMTNSEVLVENCEPTHFTAVLDLLDSIGCYLIRNKNSVQVLPSKRTLKKFQLSTGPYPQIPTDVQAQLVALALVIKGESQITETIFENRFMHVPELIRMGASITIKDNSVFIQGGGVLKGAPVMCTDLRASAALVLAALCSEGTSTINRVYHLDRGYDKMEEKLRGLQANCKRVSE
ncbi:MAG: UDP-N-acetylglucosamine 1-carboxyvinyltransferase [Bacteriovoracaceae bacterium]|nr:UDP-N-acetylglucosamine 1-carboxyvinyltransferase [Bacteriovoracaceae bacterium]